MPVGNLLVLVGILRSCERFLSVLVECDHPSFVEQMGWVSYRNPWYSHAPQQYEDNHQFQERIDAQTDDRDHRDSGDSEQE